jgi:hypothetical protein
MPMHKTPIRRAEELTGDMYALMLRTPPGAAMMPDDVEQMRVLVNELQPLIRTIEGGLRGAIQWLRDHRLLPQLGREFGPLVLAHPDPRG